MVCNTIWLINPFLSNLLKIVVMPALKEVYTRGMFRTVPKNRIHFGKTVLRYFLKSLNYSSCLLLTRTTRSACRSGTNQLDSAEHWTPWCWRYLGHPWTCTSCSVRDQGPQATNGVKIYRTLRERITKRMEIRLVYSVMGPSCLQQLI